MDERGQTLHDFALGVSVFLITLSVVLTMIPGIFTPFSASTQSQHSVIADRVASGVLDDLSEYGTRNRLDTTTTEAFFDALTAPKDATDLRGRYGVRETVSLNVTLATGDKSFAVGENYEGRAVASTQRVVTMDGRGAGDWTCSPTCRIIVRAW
jgi:hypothetical protein